MLRIVYCVKQYIIWHNNFFKEHTQIADEVDLVKLLRVQQKHLRSCFSRWFELTSDKDRQGSYCNKGVHMIQPTPYCFIILIFT